MESVYSLAGKGVQRLSIPDHAYDDAGLPFYVAVIPGFVDSKPGIPQMTDDTIHNHTLFLLCHSWCNFKFVACNALVWTNGTSALSIASEA